TWRRYLGLSAAFWEKQVPWMLKPIQAVLVLALTGLYASRRRTDDHLAPYAAAALGVFMVFNPVIWPYLYQPALVALLFATLTAYRQENVGSGGMLEAGAGPHP